MLFASVLRTIRHTWIGPSGAASSQDEINMTYNGKNVISHKNLGPIKVWSMFNRSK